MELQLLHELCPDYLELGTLASAGLCLVTSRHPAPDQHYAGLGLEGLAVDLTAWMEEVIADEMHAFCPVCQVYVPYRLTRASLTRVATSYLPRTLWCGVHVASAWTHMCVCHFLFPSSPPQIDGITPQEFGARVLRFADQHASVSVPCPAPSHYPQASLSRRTSVRAPQRCRIRCARAHVRHVHGDDAGAILMTMLMML